MKNEKHLINVIQTASYMLNVLHHTQHSKFKDKKFKKSEGNKSLSFLKQEIKRLKRY